MDGEASAGPLDPLRRLTLPVGLAVAVVVALAWYVTWTTSGWAMAWVMALPTDASPTVFSLFFLLMIVMMVAMMLPSALPMILAYRGMTRLERGQPSKPPDEAATALFATAYFLLWGAFGVLALLGLMTVGLANPTGSPLVLVPAVTLLAAGGYQFTRTKQACLTYCRSPLGFMLAHWREGRGGALRMGLRHATYCVGCCWLFMAVLFVTGVMSLLWMGALALIIFVEKIGPRPLLLSRAIAVLLLVLGGLLLVQGIHAL